MGEPLRHRQTKGVVNRHARPTATAPHSDSTKFPSPRQRAQFSGGIFNAPGIKVVGVHDFAGAVKYLGKPPYCPELTFAGGEGREILTDAKRLWRENRGRARQRSTSR